VAQLIDFLDDETKAPVEHLSGADDKRTKMSNPEFVIYVTKQNNFLLSSLSREMLEYAMSYTTPQEVWKNLLVMTLSQSWTRVITHG
jgi:superfamily I DNA and RNA helicase